MRTPALLLLAALGLAACEVPFDPIEPSDLHYSVSGYLDVSADTQWVRVEPLARTSVPSEAPLDAAVTLEGPDGGAVPLAQEVRQFATGPAHLFWTTAPVASGAAYRLVVRGPDGAETRVRVETPDTTAFSVEVTTGRYVCPARVVVRGAERVVDAQTRYLVARPGGPQAFAFPKADTFERADDGAVLAALYFADDAREMDLDPVSPQGLLRSEVVVAVATDLWPDALALTLEEALLFQSPAVEDGVGFVGGVATQRFDFVPNVTTQGFGNDRPCDG